LCAAEGLRYRAPLSPAAGTAAALAVIRARVPPLTGDRAPQADIEAIAEQIQDGSLAAAAESEVGPLA